MPRPITAVFLCGLALSGCTNQAAQQEALQRSALAENARNYMAEKARCQAWIDELRFDRIRSRIADRAPTVVQLADSGRPSAMDRALVVQWTTILDGCGGYGFGPPGGVTPEQRQLALASLASGEISYGTYNRKIAETKAAAMAKSEQAAVTAAAMAAATQAGMQAALNQAREQAAVDDLVDSMSATITNAIFAPRHRR